MNADSQTIHRVIESMLGSISDEAHIAYQSVSSYDVVASALESAKKGDYEQLYFLYCYPIEQTLDGLIEQATGNHKAQFLLKNSQFVEPHFKHHIEKIEGSACSADKSRTIMHGLLKFYMEGKKIQFNYKQEYIYGLPTTVFKTHDAIVDFFEGIHQLYFGNPDAYLKALVSIQRYYCVRDANPNGEKSGGKKYE